MKQLLSSIVLTTLLSLAGCTTLEAEQHKASVNQGSGWTYGLTQKQIVAAMPITAEKVNLSSVSAGRSIAPKKLGESAGLTSSFGHIVAWRVPEGALTPEEWIISRKSDSGAWEELTSIQVNVTSGVVLDDVAFDVYSCEIPVTAADAILTYYKVTMIDLNGARYNSIVSIVNYPGGHPVRVTLSAETEAAAPSGITAIYNDTHKILWEMERLENRTLPESITLEETMAEGSELEFTVHTDLTAFGGAEMGSLARPSNSSFCRVSKVDAPETGIVARLIYSFEDLPLSMLNTEPTKTFDYNDVVMVVDVLESEESPVPDDSPIVGVPYGGAPSPEVTSWLYDYPPDQPVDVYFLMDTTGSMYDEIDRLKTDLQDIIIPGVQNSFSNARFGVGKFEDYPLSPYGASFDSPFTHILDITDDVAATRAAIDSLTRGNGWDGPESHMAALHAIATGCGDGTGTYAVADDPDGACTNSALVGYPHFRPDAIPIIIIMSDAPSHEGPDGVYPYGEIPGVTPPAYSQVVNALNNIGAKIVAINSGNTYPGDLFARLTEDTTSLSASGDRLVFNISDSGAGLSTTIVDTFATLVGAVPIDVSARITDDPSDAVDATVFIDKIIPATAPTGACEVGLPTKDTDGDGIDDTYDSIAPGHVLCFDIIAKVNETVPATDVTQYYPLKVELLANGVVPVQEQTIYFVIPAL
ncbi:MAG: hypothetical protein JXR76_22885 [Deltaproteobacteria bacterium]|nr:hypothetical protein [Deltaproteobacteria bacterium]